MNLNQIKSSLSIILEKKGYPISCLFVYGGAVNLGGFDIFPAIPFIIYVVIVTLKRGRLFYLSTLLLLLLCIPLYYLKQDNTSRIFYPAVGSQVHLVEDMCLENWKYEKSNTYVLMNIEKNEKCDGKVVQKNSFYPIQKTIVSHADFSEKYYLWLKIDGQSVWLPYTRTKFIQWTNGDTIEEEDLRRGIFYYPSLLMFWLGLPWAILGFVSSVLKG